MTSYMNIMKDIEDKYEQAGKEAYSGYDMVNKPIHYNQAGIECIEAIRAATGTGFEQYLQGNIIKYVWRYRYKGKLQDLKKARWYLEKLIDEKTE